MSLEPDRSHIKPAVLKRVRIRNYKSIRFCDVALEPLTLLVGRNGSGKSNFVDALGFIRDVDLWGLPQAVERHGGTNAILFKRGEEKSQQLEFETTWALTARKTDDATEIAVRQLFEVVPVQGLQLTREVVTLRNHSNQVVDGYEATLNGSTAELKWKLHQPVRVSTIPMNGGSPSTLRLVSLAVESGWPILHLSGIQNYNFNPAKIRQLQKKNGISSLVPDGSNLAAVLRNLKQSNPDIVNRINQYLSAITRHITFADVTEISDYEVAQFLLKREGRSTLFDASAMSDGTLRALALLVAVFQHTLNGFPSLVAIEEPETALHPSAMHALADALDEATGRTQILVTTHSTELLDSPAIRPDNIRVVEMVDGETLIAKLDEASEGIIQRQLDSLGGLERQNLLELDHHDVERQRLLLSVPPGDAA